MASVTTAAPGKKAPWWRNLNRLSQEQVVAAIVIVLLIVFAVALPEDFIPKSHRHLTSKGHKHKSKVSGHKSKGSGHKTKGHSQDRH